MMWLYLHDLMTEKQFRSMKGKLQPELLSLRSHPQPVAQPRKPRLTYHDKRVLGTLVHNAGGTKTCAPHNGVVLHGDDLVRAAELAGRGLAANRDGDDGIIRWWPSAAGIDYWTKALTPS